MIFWACSILTIAGAVGATFISDVRRAVLALWITGLGAGGLFLSMGAELLAIIQWVLSTLVAISFIFYSVMFGEYGTQDQRPWLKRVQDAILAVVAGAGFGWMIWVGVQGLPELAAFSAAPPVKEGQDLLALGKALAEEHLLSLEILALTLFLVVIGSGVIARPETGDR